MAQQIYTIFVGDLSLFCTEQKIQDAFAEFGDILSVRIAFDEDSQKQLPYGFVDYSTLESATTAMQKMDGHVLCGRRIRVKWATNKRKDEVNNTSPTNVASSPSTYTENYNTSSVHVIYLSYQCDVLITEESLRTLFSRYGDVQDVMIKKSSSNKENGMQKGYGFVHFANTPEGIKATLSAVEDLFDSTIDNVNYTCSISRTYEKKLTSTSVATADTAARISSYMGCVETLLRNKIDINGRASPPDGPAASTDTSSGSGRGGLVGGTRHGTGMFVSDSQQGAHVFRTRPHVHQHPQPPSQHQQLPQYQFPAYNMSQQQQQQQSYPGVGGYYPPYVTAPSNSQEHSRAGAMMMRRGGHLPPQSQQVPQQRHVYAQNSLISHSNSVAQQPGGAWPQSSSYAANYSNGPQQPQVHNRIMYQQQHQHQQSSSPYLHQVSQQPLPQHGAFPQAYFGEYSMAGTTAVPIAPSGGGIYGMSVGGDGGMGGHYYAPQRAAIMSPYSNMQHF